MISTVSADMNGYDQRRTGPASMTDMEHNYEDPSSPAYDAALDGSSSAPTMAAAWSAMLAAIPSDRFIDHASVIAVGVDAGIADSTARRLVIRAMERNMIRARALVRRGFNVTWGYTTAPGGERTRADTAEWHERRAKALARSAESRQRAEADAIARAEMAVD